MNAENFSITFSTPSSLASLGRDSLAELLRGNEIRIVALESHLRQIQARLGTTAEQENDFVDCRSLAHQLASLYCVVALAEALPRPRESGPPFEHRLAS